MRRPKDLSTKRVLAELWDFDEDGWAAYVDANGATVKELIRLRAWLDKAIAFMGGSGGENV